MGTAEDAYRAALRALSPELSPAELGQAKLRLQRWLQAQRFLRDGGSPRAVYRPQQQFAREYMVLLQDFYGGKVTDQEYQQLRRAAFRRYARRLERMGLVSGVFDDAWLADFARDSLRLERQLVPVPRQFTGFTEENAALLCDPLRNRFKVFLRAVHAEFGVGRLRTRPEVYGGVDSTRCELEEQEAPSRAAV